MLARDQILFLDKVCLNFFGNRTWVECDGVINVAGGVNVCNMNLSEFPVQFGEVSGYFDCRVNRLTTLKGSPTSIGGYFTCAHNELTTLEYGPTIVAGSYSCSHNLLTSLQYSPKKCEFDFYCHSNLLTSLEGGPSLIGWHFDCRYNSGLRVLYGLGRVNGKFYCDVLDDLNMFIREQARMDIFVTYADISEWIKRNNRLEFLLYAPEEVRSGFSPRILQNADSGLYNESL